MKMRDKKHELVVDYLSDRNLFESIGDVSDTQKRGIYKGMMHMPLSSLQRMKDAKIKITIADDSSFKTLTNNPTSLGFFRPKGSNFLSRLANSSKGQIAVKATETTSPSLIKKVLLHEAGHALDRING